MHIISCWFITILTLSFIAFNFTTFAILFPQWYLNSFLRSGNGDESSEAHRKLIGQGIGQRIKQRRFQGGLLLQRSSKLRKIWFILWINEQTQETLEGHRKHRWYDSGHITHRIWGWSISWKQKHKPGLWRLWICWLKMKPTKGTPYSFRIIIEFS